MHRIRYGGLVLATLLVLLGWCFAALRTEADSNPSLPVWLTQKIAALQSGPLGPPSQVLRYVYRNKIVYYIPSTQCCDRYSTLYDADGKVLCAPDGGFTGTGDGRCPDFRNQRRDGVIVWPAQTRGSPRFE